MHPSEIPPVAPSSPPPGPVRRAFGEVKQFVREEPVAAVAAVCAVGLLVKLLPKRWVVGTVTVVSTALIRPALVSLGLTKALEMYLEKPHQAT